MSEPVAGRGVAPSARLSVSRRTLATLVLVLLAGAATVGGIVFVRSSVGPIEADGGGLSGRVPFPGTEYRRIETFDAGLGETYLVDGNGKGAFGVQFEVENTGRFAVTLRSTSADEGLVMEKRVRIYDRPIEVDPAAGDAVPVDGVTLEPGERRLLETTFRWSRLCPGPQGGGHGVSGPVGVTLRYTAFGGLYAKEQFLELPIEVALLCGRKLPKTDGWIVTSP